MGLLCLLLRGSEVLPSLLHQCFEVCIIFDIAPEDADVGELLKC